jgi:hypothetical protein
MSALGTGKGLLEIGKFAVYVAVPVALTYAVATENKTFQEIMGLVRSFSSLPFHSIFLMLTFLVLVLCGSISITSYGMSSSLGVFFWHVQVEAIQLHD